jgi:hypothetical protein
VNHSRDDEIEIPEPTERHRSEVNKRARVLTRKRRLAGSAVTAGALAAVVAIAVLTVQSSGSHQTKVATADASPHARSEGRPASGSLNKPRPTPVPTTAPTPTVSTNTTVPTTSPFGPPTTTPVTPTLPRGGATGGPVNGGQSADQTFTNLPSGTSQPLYENNFGIVTLSAPPQRQWGNAVVTSGGTSLVIYQQTPNSSGGVQVIVESGASGTATVTIPVAGYPAGDWTITFVISGSAVCENNGVYC